MSKVRRVDYMPDEYISGVGNVLNATEQGVYWMVCSLIMSEGGAIVENHQRIAGLCLIRPSQAKKIIDRLVEVHGRSEERRVGKGSGTWRWLDDCSVWVAIRY